MDLRFVGDLPLWGGVALAVVFAIGAWVLYRREVRGRREHVSWSLPLIRTLVVFFVLLMLTGPVLRMRYEEGRLSRVFIFVDGSQSMGRPDADMAAHRKLLIAQRLGWLSDNTVDEALHDAAIALRAARRTAELGPDTELTTQAILQAAAGVRSHVDDATNRLGGATSDPLSEAWRTEFDRDVTDAAHTLAQSDPAKSDAAELSKQLDELASSLSKWAQRLGSQFENQAQLVVERNDDSVADALARFDQTSRWRRVASALLEGDNGLINQLADRHQVELLTLPDEKPQRLWWSQDMIELPRDLSPDEPVGPNSNLSDGLRDRVGEGQHEDKIAVIVLTDGQHNQGRSPLQTAKVFGNRGVPVFTVGVGAVRPPTDLAVADVKGPKEVYLEDRVEGTVLLEDHMPPGKPFMLRITLDGDVLWERRLVTAKSGRREIDFDFPIKQQVQDLLAGAMEQDLQVLSLPLSMMVSVDALSGEIEEGNNEAELRVRAITQRRRVLVLDGRPRWELRYLRNLFERDEKWRVNELLASLDVRDDRWPRGDQPGQFPKDRQTLYSYDLIVFGDVPRAAFTLQELEWIQEFVGKRGGGLIFIAGRRGRLTEYADTPLDSLLPVRWMGPSPDALPSHFRLTAAGLRQSSLRLAPGTSDLENQQLWNRLPAPHHVAAVAPQPGAESLVEAFVEGEPTAAVVRRRFGGGQVLFCAFDESWRWRYDVGDRYHQRYWNQLANWVMEAPYAVKNKLVSIDAGEITYMAGQSADIRIRLRDDQGRPVKHATAEAVLYRDGQLYGSLPLTADEGDVGVFRGKTDQLEEGRYEVGVRVTGVADEDLAVRAEFAVLKHETGELTVLHCNEPLLRDMAAASDGAYIREEDTQTLAGRLAPFSDGRIVESEIVLWQSYWWFAPLVTLLTLEWVIRKRAGLI